MQITEAETMGIEHMAVERISPEYHVEDKIFETFLLANVKLKRLATGFDWAEGPVWMGDAGFLLFSDIPNNTVYRWSPVIGLSTYLNPSNYANGHYRDLQGRLISCEQGPRRITRMEHDGTLTVLVDRFEGKRLNSPNDVVVKSDGTIWFTDPYYGIKTSYEGIKARQERPCGVYCYWPETGELRCVTTRLDCPNGLAFSLDEKFLYLSDTGLMYEPLDQTGIHKFVVSADLKVAEKPVVSRQMDCGVPDGFRLDTEGNIWTSAGDGVHCYDPDLNLLGKIYIPEVVSNVCFGGRDKQILYMTATNSIYSIALNREGIQHP